jgi:hypothetical protein
MILGPVSPRVMESRHGAIRLGRLSLTKGRVSPAPCTLRMRIGKSRSLPSGEASEPDEEKAIF